MKECAEAERARTCSSQQTPRNPQDPHIETDLIINPKNPPDQPYTLPEQPILQGNFPSPPAYDQLSKASLQTPPGFPPPPYLSHIHRSSESAENSDGPPLLEDITSDSGYYADAEN